MKFSDSPEKPDALAVPQPRLPAGHAIALIVGIVIGAGIFKSPSVVADMSAQPLWMFSAWLLGGLVSVVGALCYAELATAYPHAGGDYHFLGRAYGRSLAFFFAWARFSVITTGSIALLAFILGDYLQVLWPLPGLRPALGGALYAAVAVLLLSWLNLRGLRAGTRTQTVLTVAEIGGLLLIVIAALSLPAADSPPSPAAAALPEPGAFGLAMVFVLLTFGGWNEAAYISAELKDNQRNMGRVLLASLAIITVLYLLVVWAYWRGLGMDALAASDAVAAALLARAFGTAGESVMAVLVIIATLTSMNATLFVGARTSFAAGRDWPALHRLGVWEPVRGTPANALRAQAAMALLLIAAGAWGGNGFRAMVEFTAPVFWGFFLLSGLSLFVLRWREPTRPRPFRVPGYPFTPLLFVLVCAAMLWSSLSHVRTQTMGGISAGWVGVAVLASGALLLLTMRRWDAQVAAAPSVAPPERRTR